MKKTNVMEILDKAGVSYTPHDYVESGAVAGVDVAKAIGADADRLYKTIVMSGDSGTVYVFMIPAERRLKQKKAARYLGEKKLEMLTAEQLMEKTGYTHGGCSPIGTTEKLRTIFHKDAEGFDTIIINAGEIGYLVELSFEELAKVLDFEFADILS